MLKRAWLLVFLCLAATGCEAKPKAKPSISNDAAGSALPRDFQPKKIATH